MNMQSDMPPVLRPPTRPGALQGEARPAQWPLVLGIIAIILGAMGVLSRVGGGVAMYFVQFFVDSMDPEANAMMGAFGGEWIVWTIIAYVIGAVLGVALLVGGIGLVKRAAWSVPVVIAWAWAKILFVMGEVVLQVFVTRHQFEVMQQQPGGAAMPAGMENLMLVLGLATTLLMGMALPIVCLVMLKLATSKREIETWA